MFTVNKLKCSQPKKLSNKVVIAKEDDYQKASLFASAPLKETTQQVKPQECKKQENSSLFEIY